MPYSVIFAAAFACTMALSTSAAAQVLEIGNDGGVVVRSGPAVTTDLGVTSLLPTPRPADPVEAEIAAAAQAYRVDARLVHAVAVQESNLNQAARSPRGAVGVMQLMPFTAAALGVDPADLHGNVQGGAAYLHRMLQRFGGDVRLALAAYNAGPGAVERSRGVPPFAETQAYVRQVLERVAPSAFASSGALP